ncbi:MAG: DUF493 family protein [Oligoflexia bacterium]|nr:DUF493 family protein [Oligoflexia bacterium]
MTSKKSADFGRLRTLLENHESFPVEFPVKFVGKNSETFKAGTKRFEADHPFLKQTSCRVSAKGNHLAYTFAFTAESPDQIIQVLEAVHQIEDILVIL